MLLQASSQRLTLFQVFNGRKRLGLGNESFFQGQILLEVVLLKLLVDVDVVEELVAKAVVLVVHLLVAIARDVSSRFPLFTNLIEPGKSGPDVFLFLNDVFEFINQGRLHFKVGALFFGNALAPGLFAGLEGIYEFVELDFFGTGLKLKFLVRFVVLFGPSISLGSKVLLDQSAKRFDVSTHILPDGFQILVFQQGLDTLQKF